MHDISSIFLQLVGIYRQSIYIAILKTYFSCLAFCTVIEFAICSYTIAFIIENRMTKNIGNFIVLVIPYEWYFPTAIITESSWFDCQTIGASLIISRSNTAEIKFVSHFDVSPFLVFFIFIWRLWFAFFCIFSIVNRHWIRFIHGIKIPIT